MQTGLISTQTRSIDAQKLICVNANIVTSAYHMASYIFWSAPKGHSSNTICDDERWCIWKSAL